MPSKWSMSSQWHNSSNIKNEVIRAVLNPFLFFYEKISHAQKAQKRNQAKAQNATSEQK